MRRILIMLGLLALVLPVGLLAQKPVRVFIYPKANTDGFVDSSRLTDSVKDVQEALGKYKNLTWTFTKETADITLEIASSGRVDAGTETQTRTGRGVLGGLISTTDTHEKVLPNLTAVLGVKGSEYTKTFSITNQMFWKDLAKNIAAQLNDWVKTNGAKFRTNPEID